MRCQNCWLRRAGAAFLAGSLLSGCTVVGVHRSAPEMAGGYVRTTTAWRALHRRDNADSVQTGVGAAA